MVPPEKNITYASFQKNFHPVQSVVDESYLSTGRYGISYNSHECSDISISPPPQLMVPRHLWEECLPAADLHHKPKKKRPPKKKKLIVPAWKAH